MNRPAEELVAEFKKKTEKYVSLIDLAIEELLEEYSNTGLYEPMVYALEGGKRIRPLLLLLTTEVVGGDVGKALKASAAIELLHTESLIHDDIIDMTTIRRGKPAFHVSYDYYTSLLSADFVFGVILRISSQYMDKRIADGISEAALKMCDGEMEELKVRENGASINWEDYLRIAGNKTASLFEASTKIGAIIGNAGLETVEQLARFGYNLGLAYQMRDDIIDLNGSPILFRIKVEDSILNLLKKELKNRIEISRRMLEGLKECKAKEMLSYLISLIESV